MVACKVGVHPGVLSCACDTIPEAHALQLVFVVDADGIFLCLFALNMLGGRLIDPLALIGLTVRAEGRERVIGLIVLVHRTQEEVPII
ncbi:Uncharacterised protein [Chlamydia trachomatis]|nr:Uncharacterised protein [Chlamydia trachomatis]